MHDHLPMTHVQSMKYIHTSLVGHKTKQSITCKAFFSILEERILYIKHYLASLVFLEVH